MHNEAIRSKGSIYTIKDPKCLQFLVQRYYNQMFLGLVGFIFSWRQSSRCRGRAAPSAHCSSICRIQCCTLHGCTLGKPAPNETRIVSGPIEHNSCQENINCCREECFGDKKGSSVKVRHAKLQSSSNRVISRCTIPHCTTHAIFQCLYQRQYRCTAGVHSKNEPIGVVTTSMELFAPRNAST